jgi:hypothetical protein
MTSRDQAAGEPVGEREVIALVAPSSDEPLRPDRCGRMRNGGSAMALSETILSETWSRRDVAPRVAGATQAT